MNDIRESDGGDGRGSSEGDVAGARAGRLKRCCQPSSRKKRDEMIVLSSAVVCCFLPMFVVAGGSGGKKGADAKVPVVAVAGGGGGGGATGADGSGAASEAREKMEADGSKMVKVSLIFAEGLPLPGAESSLGTLEVAFDIEKGWHTYWRNAGDSGMPPTFEFTVDPPGAVEIGEAQWPAPQRHVSDGDILDYIYEGRALHYFEVKQGPAYKAGDTVKINCKASWLVCKEACLPGEGEVGITIRPSGVDHAAKPREEIPIPHGFGLSFTELPKPLSSEAPVQVAWKGGMLEITSRGSAVLAFFPYGGDGDAIPLDLVKSGESNWRQGVGQLRLRFDPKDLDGLKQVTGVISMKGSPQDAGYRRTQAFELKIATPRPPE